MESKHTELKDCPECTSSYIELHEPLFEFHVAWAKCNNCRFQIEHKNIERVIDLWNTYPTLQAKLKEQEECIGRLRDALELVLEETGTECYCDISARIDSYHCGRCKAKLALAYTDKEDASKCKVCGEEKRNWNNEYYVCGCRPPEIDKDKEDGK